MNVFPDLLAPTIVSTEPFGAISEDVLLRGIRIVKESL
jgi:hypothetical protein